MDDFLRTGRNWEHVLAVVLFLARVADVGSLYLVTPTRLLIANPIVRKLGWPFALLTIGLCFVPYYHTGMAMVLIAWSLVAAMSNLSKAYIVRALGEANFLRALQQAAGRRPGEAIAFVLGSSGAVALVGLVLLGISGGPTMWSFAFAVGVILYACGMAMFGCLFVRRLYREDGQHSASSRG